MKARRIILIFVAATLIVTALVYVIVTSTTPLSTPQVIGVGAAFLLGWAGLAYAGSTALQGVLQRSSTFKRLAALREATFSRIFLSSKARD